MVRQNAYFDNLQAVADYQKSGHPGMCKSSRTDDHRTHSYLKPCINTWQCVDCEIHGHRFRRKAQRVIYRAMSNFVIYGIGLWFVTVRLKYSTKDPDYDWSTFRKKWASLHRLWKRQAPSLEYVRLVSIGRIAETLHIHMVATAEPPDYAGLDVYAQPIGADGGDMDRHIRQVVNYLRENMRDPAPDIHSNGKRLSFSKHFIDWSESALLHRQKQSSKNPTLLYVFTVSADGQHATLPPLQDCTICDQKLPHTIDYFHKNQNRLRGECRRCFKFKNAALHANHRTLKIEQKYQLPDRFLGRVTAGQIKELVDNAAMSKGWLCFWKNDVIQEWCIDHIEPLSNGGKNTIHNLCVTSRATNDQKSDKSLSEWLSTLAGHGYRHPLMPDDWKVTRPLALRFD